MFNHLKLKAMHKSLAARCLIVVLLTGILILLPATTWTLLAPVASAQIGSRPALYTDDNRFYQLSGAARTALERIYGRKPTTLILAPSPLEIIPDGSPFPNILVNDVNADTTAQDTQSETTLVLGAGPNVVVSFNDSGSNVGSRPHFTGYSVSSDGGNNFVDRGTLPDSSVGDAGDPVLARDKVSSTIYLSTLGFNTFEQVQLFRSFDNGSTFTTPVNATPGFGSTGDFQDKEWIAADNFPGLGQGNVYLAWRNFFFNPPGSGGPYGIRFTRSTDGGNTWGPNRGILIADQGANNVQGAFVTVGPDHTVYVFWYDQSIGSQTRPFINMRKSTDQGQTFGPTMTVARLKIKASNGDLGLNGGFRTNAFPQAAVNPATNNIYVVYNDRTGTGDAGDIFLTQSVDGGLSWTPAVRVNDDATLNDQWQPALAVTPDGRALFVGFYDRRLSATNVKIVTFGATATISGSTVTFGANVRIGSKAFPPIVGQDPSITPTYMGDYDQAVSDNNFFYYTWGDNRFPSAVHGKQPDVRFAQIPAPF